MKPSPRTLAQLVLLAVLLPLALARPASATEYDVPNVFASLAAAVTAAEGSIEPDNAININAPLISTGAEVIIDDSFDANRKLVIRPGPLSGLTRATIASTNGSEPLLNFDDAGYVTIQDLDLVRNSTNNDHLILMDYAATGNNHITFDRCRIGSIWTTPGSAGWSYLYISRPTEILVRNCIFFSYVPGTFDRGINVLGFADPANSIRLYNNVVADFKLFGIVIEDGLGSTFVVVRNNIVVSHPTIAPEPIDFRSNVVAGVTVVSSHNTVFSSGGALVEMNVGVQSVALPGSPSFLIRPRVAVDDAFSERTWDLAPPWDPNPDFFRLEVAGPIHGASNGAGQTLGNGSPHGLDIALLEDIEHDARPSGSPLHTDRGPDQIERGTGSSTGIEPLAGGAASWLIASPRTNPAREVAVRYRATQSGRIEFQVADLSGRRLFADTRTVTAGDAGVFEWPATGFTGPAAYRIRLTQASGHEITTSGRITIVR